MKIVAIVSSKGGVGKTSLATALAGIAASRGKRVLLIDTDPQTSSSDWYDAREEAEVPGDVEVICAPGKRIKRLCRHARNDGIDLVLIDTPPAPESYAYDAAIAADIVISPLRTGAFDIWSINQINHVLSRARKSLWVVLNAVPARGKAASEAEEALKKENISVAPVKIVQRVDFNKAALAGMSPSELNPRGRAAEEIEALYGWVMLQAS